MTMIGNNARLRYSLNGQPSSAPDKIESTEFIADFGAENIQANVTATSWTFANADAETIIAWINAGKIYQGLPFKIEVYNDSSNVVGFDGLLDLTDNYENRFSDEVRVKCNMVKASGSNIFFDQLSAISFAFLESKAVFANSDYTDLNYVVQKKINLLDELMVGVVLYLMVKELISTIKNIAETIGNTTAHAGGGITGSIVAVIYTILVIALEVAYSVAIIIAILKLAKQLFETFIPPVRTHKTINLHTAMEKVVGHLGYTFNTTITDLDELYYLPSNPQLESEELANFLTVSSGTVKGIPGTTDGHYKCAAFFELMKKMFNGKFAVINGVVQFHSKGAPYWVLNSTYKMPSVRPNYTTTNAVDAVSSKVLSFAYDLNDEYTVDNQDGRIYEIQTTVQSLPSQSVNILKGFENIDFDVCLAERKTELMPLEKALQGLASILDEIVLSFGGSSDYAAKVVNNRVGVMKQTKNNHSLPKIVKISGGKLPVNYRNVFSAKVLYDKYYAFDSFVLNNFNGQKELHKDVTVPFGLSNFNELIDNSYFLDEFGTEGKIMSIKWHPTRDIAKVDYWIRKVFTTDLVETYINP